MSKPVKELVRQELIRRFGGLTSLAVVDLTRVDAVATNQIRARLRAKDIRVMVVRNSLARQAFRELGLPQAAELLTGPSAVAYGTGPGTVEVVTVVRELLDASKEAPTLTVKGALLDGEVFDFGRIEELSRYPTRAEALGRLLVCFASAGGRLGGCLLGPGARLASVVKAIERTRQGGEADAA